MEKLFSSLNSTQVDLFPFFFVCSLYRRQSISVSYRTNVANDESKKKKGTCSLPSSPSDVRYCKLHVTFPLTVPSKLIIFLLFSLSLFSIADSSFLLYSSPLMLLSLPLSAKRVHRTYDDDDENRIIHKLARLNCSAWFHEALFHSDPTTAATAA